MNSELKIRRTHIKTIDKVYNYYELTLENENFGFHESFINILSKNYKEFHYIAEIDLNFTEFIAKFGGLMGLYFGLTFIDLSILLKRIAIFVKILLIKLLYKQRVKTIIEYLKVSIKKIEYLIRKLPKLPWKKIVSGISFPLLFSQMVILLFQYFQYSTQTSFEFIEYKIRENQISIDEFPAITVCNELNNFDKGEK